MKKNFLLLGIDGGATKVSGWEIHVDPDRQTFKLGEAQADRSYRDIPGHLPEFTPVPIPRQLKERDENAIKPTAEEEQQAAVYVEACAQVIEEIVKRTGNHQALVGLGMPGLKTPDRRGIGVVANGPRMIHYCRQLEERLQMADIRLITPIDHIGSDADYCGIGENYSDEGLFSDVVNAYYLGGGTGVADAMKLDGELVPFDATKEWMAKSWEMKADDGRSLERFASAGGIQSIYADLSGVDVAELNQKHIFPLQMAELAHQGDTVAKDTYALVVEKIARLLFERITTLYSGCQGVFEFLNPNRPALATKHEFMGKLWERIIIGQRLGEVLDSSAGKEVVRLPLIQKLQQLINSAGALDEKAKKHYRDIDNLIKTSKLREAPVIGAGIDAYLTYTSNQ